MALPGPVRQPTPGHPARQADVGHDHVDRLARREDAHGGLPVLGEHDAMAVLGQDLVRKFAVTSGLMRSRREVEDQADLIVALHREPGSRDLAWRLVPDDEVTDGDRRRAEIAAFVEGMVVPTRKSGGDLRSSACPATGGVFDVRGGETVFPSSR